MQYGSRTRISRDNSYQDTVTWEAQLATTGAWVNVGVYHTDHIELDQMHDVVTDRFRERVAAGEIINNPMRKEIQEVIAGGGSFSSSNASATPYKAIRLTGGGSITGACTQRYLPVYQPFVLTDPGVAISDAKARAIAGIDSTPYSFLEDLLEVRKTISGLTQPFTALRDLSKKFQTSRRNRYLKTRDLAFATASTWLEYRFSIMPLVMSISNMQKSMIDSQIERSGVRSKFGFDRRTARAFSPIDDKSIDYFAYNLAGSTKFRHWGTAKGDARAGILYKVSNPIDTFSEKHGLRLKDLPRGLWAITPYSWLIDRWFNVSDFIQGVVNLADPNVVILAAWTKVEQELVDHKQFIDVTTPGWKPIIASDVLTENFVYKARDPWVPHVADAVPKFSTDVNTKTLLDMAALITQRFTRI